MARADELVSTLRQGIAGVEARLFEHPWVAAVEEGRCSREDLRSFAAQQRRIIASDLKSVALLVHRYGDSPSGRFFADSLKTEAAAFDALAGFAGHVGGESAEEADAELLAGAQAYTHFVAWLALYGSDAEFAAAFLVNLPAWGKNCGRLARALRARYGMADSAVAFFDLFAGDAPGFAEAALAVIQGGLDRGVSPVRIREAAHLLQRYELMYWDALQAGAESRRRRNA
ncbi:MAG: transcriptional regulator [Zetaproteobacteria bacterium]|nr:MAG: transcriptional regulator [Zetaproteobacteria bacterium]